MSIQTGSKIVDFVKLKILLLLVHIVLIMTFDFKLDFCPYIFCIIGFKMKICNIYYGILIIVPKGLLVT